MEPLNDRERCDCPPRPLVMENLQRLVDELEKLPPDPAPALKVDDLGKTYGHLLSPRVNNALRDGGHIKSTLGQYNEDDVRRMTASVYLSVTCKSPHDEYLAALLIAADLERLARAGELRGYLAGFSRLPLVAYEDQPERTVIFFFPHVKAGLDPEGRIVYGKDRLTEKEFVDKLNGAAFVREGEVGPSI